MEMTPALMDDINNTRVERGDIAYLHSLSLVTYTEHTHDGVDYSRCRVADNTLNTDWLLRNMHMCFLRSIRDLYHHNIGDTIPTICLFRKHVSEFIEMCELMEPTITITGTLVTNSCPYDEDVVCVFWLPHTNNES